MSEAFPSCSKALPSARGDAKRWSLSAQELSTALPSTRKRLPSMSGSRPPARECRYRTRVTSPSFPERPPSGLVRRQFRSWRRTSWLEPPPSNLESLPSTDGRSPLDHAIALTTLGLSPRTRGVPQKQRPVAGAPASRGTDGIVVVVNWPCSPLYPSIAIQVDFSMGDLTGAQVVVR